MWGVGSEGIIGRNIRCFSISRLVAGSARRVRLVYVPTVGKALKCLVSVHTDAGNPGVLFLRWLRYYVHTWSCRLIRKAFFSWP